MERSKLSLTVVKDECLGYEVFRGSAAAGVLAAASWIDFHDPDSNVVGYQRDFDAKRSMKAATYAETQENVFWPECILAIRDNAEVAEDDQKVNFEFRALEGTGDRFGTLEVEYNGFGTELINGKDVPWRRALSQVDCQHRLGSLGESKRPITFCIFPGITRREEAIIFRTINAQQKKMTTSLVDAIIWLTDPDAPNHIKWAWALGRDPGSPYNKLVWTGGRGRTPAGSAISLAGLHQTLEILMPNRIIEGLDYDYCYSFARNFWLAVRSLWPSEFSNKGAYKLQTTPGQPTLARFGREIFTIAIPTLETSQDFIRDAFDNDPLKIDWAKGGPLRLATGKGGQRDVFELLGKKYGLPPN